MVDDSRYYQVYRLSSSLKLVTLQCLMNNSSQALKSLTKTYKTSPDSFILVHDDIDTAFGKVRYTTNVSHRGHNGVRSIINSFQGNKSFGRLLIGVGRPLT